MALPHRLARSAMLTSQHSLPLHVPHHLECQHRAVSDERLGAGRLRIRRHPSSWSQSSITVDTAANRLSL